MLKAKNVKNNSTNSYDKSIYFVSVIRISSDMANSTHIMTEGLLKGLKKNGVRVTFFAICEEERIIKPVVEYYSNIVDQVIPLKSIYGVIYGNFRQLYAIAHGCFFPQKHKKTVLDAIGDLPSPDLIISHSPSYEALHFAKILKNHYKTTLYEYWSDPLALSGINPEQFNIKRMPFYFLEKMAFRYADRVIYGTKTLMQFQGSLYPNYKSIMYYVDVPYVHEQAQILDAESNRLIYAGNYYSSIRNIVPLACAVSKSKKYILDVYGGGDVDLSSYNHVNVHGRITPAELSQIERNYKNIVCILNSSCIQIPGKVFYSSNQKTNIIVITDGVHKKEITDYLKKYDRYILCDNAEEDVTKALNQLDVSSTDWVDMAHYSPCAIARDLLNGGRKE